MVVGRVVQCGNMFRVSMARVFDGADEVCRVGGTRIGLDIPTENQCSDE